jgi:hypothetical protein
MNGRNLLGDTQTQGRNLLAESDPPKPPEPEPKKPTLASEFAETGKRAATMGYGAVTGLLGSFGELEKFGAYDVPEFFGLREKGERDQLMGRETIFPTTEEVRKGLSKVGVERPKEQYRGYETAGEIVGGLGTALPSLAKTGTRALLGTPSRVSEATARKAEDLGFKLSPAQVRQDVPISAKGATGAAQTNQTLANKLATEGTGKATTEITPEFIGTRLKDLGKEFDNVYKGKTFAVDSSIVGTLNNIIARESELGFAGVSSVRQAAQSMLDNIQAAGTYVVQGDDLQRLRNAMTQSARSTASRGNAHEIYELVDVIDNAVGTFNPAVTAKLSELRPLYRNSIILEDLYRKGGIRQGNISLEMLGDMLRGKRDAVRRTAQDIDELGELGRELRLRARWQEVGAAETPSADVLKKALGTTMGSLASLTGLRSATARKAQRALARKPVTPAEGVGAITGAGAMLPREEPNE